MDHRFMKFITQPFSSLQLLSTPHIQTILPHFLRTGQGVSYDRKGITLPDGDFLDLDFAVRSGITPEEHHSLPLVLLLHGLEGSSHSGYIFESVRQLAPYELQTVALNFRGCSGELNRAPRAYHSGETEDLAFVIRWLSEKFPSTPLAAVGFSLGANMLLKYLGENEENTPLEAAVAVSPPFDLGRGSDIMAMGFNIIYTQTFLRRLKRKAIKKADQYRTLVELPAILSAPNLREFDNAFVAPIYGFRDADDYYAQSSSGQYLPGIRTPTLIIRSKDDPFFDPADIPYDALNSNPSVTPSITEHGGHVGFMEGLGRYYAEREAARFLSENLNADSVDLSDFR
jgi:predicted alpha/beta-fold hydrolase